MSSRAGTQAGDDGLFTPFRLGNLTLANRFVMPAMQRGWSTNWGPDDRLVDYYAKRAEGGVPLLTSESLSLDHPTSAGMPDALYLDDTTLDGWKRCVDAVHAAGGTMLMQLYHEGAIKNPGEGRYPDAPTVSPSGLVIGGQASGRPATLDELDEILAAYVKAARQSREIGADGVEVHAAHGFLLDQFLWSKTNLRTDEYGGPSILERARFPLKVVEAIRHEVGPDFLIGLKWSQWKAYDYDALICESPDELAQMLAAFGEASVQYFHVSSRYFWKTEWDTDKTIARWCKQLTDLPIITVGSVGLDIDMWTNFLEADEPRSTVESSIAELRKRHAAGDFDLVAIGRGLISDPDWVKKVQAGRYDEIRVFHSDHLETENWNLEGVDISQDAQSTA